MIIKSQLQEMAESDIKANIDPDKYKDIKKDDRQPLFKAFVLGHEGQSSGRVVGQGNIIKKWVSSAIQLIYDKLQIGTKVFFKHGKDNSHRDRQPLGEVVGKTLERINDKLSAVGIVYVNKDNRDLKTDIASIETDNFQMDYDNNVLDIGNVTGVALGDSTNMRAGFPGATLQGALQEMAEQNLSHKGNGGINKMDIKDVMNYIKENQTKPDDLFNRNELEKVDWIIGLRESKKRLHNKFDEKQDGFDKMEIFKKDQETKYKELETKFNVLNLEKVKLTSNELLDKKIEDRKLEGKKKEYVKSGYKDFNLKDATEIDKQLDTFMDSIIDDFDKKAKFFGLKKDDKKEDTLKPNIDGKEIDPLKPE